MGIGRLGMPELILLLVIALVIFGPSKLPEIGRSLGNALKEFKSSVEKTETSEKEAGKKEETSEKEETDEKEEN